MATITVRALDQNWDPNYGNGQACFLSDLDAVTQILAQRLKLFEGEWWENLSDGLPLFQSILGAPAGQKNLEVIIGLISARITGTVFVTGPGNITASFSNRALLFSAEVPTQFGTVFLTNRPASSASL